MVEKHSKHWLLLSPKVHTEIKNGRMLLYNTENGEIIETDSSAFRELILELQKDINLGVIEYSTSYRNNSKIADFIEDAVQKKILILTPQEEDKHKPMVLLPILNLQRDIDKLSEYGHEYFLGRDILNYLNLLNIYINGDCDSNCSGCDSYYKQFPSCAKRRSNNNLSPENVGSILSQIQFSNAGTINILGGNIYQYDYWEHLWSVLNDFEFDYHFWLNLKNVPDDSVWMGKVLCHNIEILISPDVVLEGYSILIDWLASQPKVKFHLIVESIDDGVKAEKLAETIGEDKVVVVPFYNGSNLDFFRDNIFLDREDIFADPISMRTIFCNQKLNSNFFGTLTILPNGDVMSNPNKSILENMHNTPLIELIYNEMLSKSSWRSTRIGAKCSECLYQYLCPPPSNYELSLGRENLCNVV